MGTQDIGRFRKAPFSLTEGGVLNLNMRKILPLLLVSILSTSCQTGNNYSEEVYHYVETFNSRNIEEYVDLLIPAEYGSKEEYKIFMIDAYKNALEDDDRILSDIQVVHSVEKEGETQILFSAQDGNSSPTFFISTSEAGNKLRFSTFFSSNMRIDQVTAKIPDLDRSFYELIEPGWENVIRFKVGERIPDLKWTSISGNEINSSELSDQTIVLNFWHTTCPPCIKEIPELNQLVSLFPEVNFIAPIPDSDADYLQDIFLAKYNFDYEVVIVNGKDYNVYSFPQHIVIKDSKVIEIIEGYSPGNISKLEKAIDATI